MQIDERTIDPDAPLWDTPEGKAVTFCLNPRPKDPKICLRCGRKTTTSGIGQKKKGENPEGLPFCTPNCRIIFYLDLEFARDHGCTPEIAKSILLRLLS